VNGICLCDVRIYFYAWKGPVCMFVLEDYLCMLYKCNGHPLYVCIIAVHIWGVYLVFKV
jgi:hypothetical protein